MVVGDGSVLTASATENPDLFWAIRGGGCNFGVCAQFVLKLYEQRRTIFSGAMTFPPSALEKVVKTTEAWYTNPLSVKEGMLQVLTRAPDGSVRPRSISSPEID